MLKYVLRIYSMFKQRPILLSTCILLIILQNSFGKEKTIRFILTVYYETIYFIVLWYTKTICSTQLYLLR